MSVSEYFAERMRVRTQVYQAQLRTESNGFSTAASNSHQLTQLRVHFSPLPRVPQHGRVLKNYLGSEFYITAHKIFRSLIVALFKRLHEVKQNEKTWFL
jgi:hypothetical protein